MSESAIAIAIASPSAPLEHRLDIAGIPTLVVDPHHHVLPFWFEQLQGKGPAHLFHVDAHNDMGHLEYCSRQRPVVPPKDCASLRVYSMNELHEGNFICPAAYLGLLRSIYHFNPRLKNAADVHKGKSTRFRREVSLHAVYHPDYKLDRSKHGLGWSKSPDDPSWGMFFSPIPYHRRTQVNNTIRRINEDRYPFALDIDLDAFQCILDPRDDDLSKEAYQKRFGVTLDILARMRNPSFITIARSQTPTMYVPADQVDQIQADLLAGFQQLYASRTSNPAHRS